MVFYSFTKCDTPDALLQHSVSYLSFNFPQHPIEMAGLNKSASDESLNVMMDRCPLLTLTNGQ